MKKRISKESGGTYPAGKRHTSGKEGKDSGKEGKASGKRGFTGITWIRHIPGFLLKAFVRLGVRKFMPDGFEEGSAQEP